MVSGETGAAARATLLALVVTALSGLAWVQHGEVDPFLNRLHRETPAAFEGSDLERVTALRDWAYRNIDAAGTPDAYDHRNFEVRSPADIFAGFDRDEGGVYCGNAAVTLRNLYTFLGWEAWTLDMGLPGLLTHVTTLVRLDDGRIVVQDAYFGGTFTRDGEVVDIRDALGDLSAAEWTEPDLGVREILSASGVEEKPMDLLDMEQHVNADATHAELERLGIDDGLLGMFLLPLTTTGPHASGLLESIQASVTAGFSADTPAHA